MSVSIVDKKYFIRRFLNHYMFRRRECHWIFNYLLERHDALENVRFVDSLEKSTRGLIMNTQCAEDKDEPPFQYIATDGRDGILTTDAEKAFHDIRLKTDEILYVELRFSNRNSCPQWYNVLEDNPHASINIPVDLLLAADSLVHTLEFNYRLARVDAMIEKALDEGDRKSFMEATALRNTMLRVKPKVMYETVRS